MTRMCSLRTPYSIGFVKGQTLRAGMPMDSLFLSFSKSPLCVLHKVKICNYLCECNLNRQSFVKALEPFVNWLEEAEEEEWIGGWEVIDGIVLQFLKYILKPSIFWDPTLNFLCLPSSKFGVCAHVPIMMNDLLAINAQCNVNTLWLWLCNLTTICLR